MTAFDHIKCSNCCNWSRRSDLYGECVVMMDEIILNAVKEQKPYFDPNFEQ